MTRLDSAVMKPYDKPQGDLARLGKAIAERQDALRDADALRAEAFTKLFEQPAKRAPRVAVRRRWMMAALALCTLVVLLIVQPWRATTQSLTFTAGDGTHGVVGKQLIAKQQVRVLRFSDGTIVTLHLGTEARVSQLVDGNAIVVLDDGRLSAQVVHNEDTRWLFWAGKYRVLVTGTAFDMSWSSRDGTFSVTMIEGTVLVTDIDGTKHRISASTSHDRFPAKSAASSSLPEKPPTPSQPTTSPENDTPAPATSPSASAPADPVGRVGVGSASAAGRTTPPAAVTTAPVAAPPPSAPSPRPLPPKPKRPPAPPSPGDIWGKLDREGKNK